MGLFDNMSVEDLKKKFKTCDDSDKEKIMKALDISHTNDPDILATIQAMQRDLLELKEGRKTPVKKSGWDILFGEDK